MQRIFCQSRGYEINNLACVPGDKACNGCQHNHARPPLKEIAAEAIKFFGPDADLFFSLCGSLKQKQQECLEAIKDVPEDPIADHPEEVIALARKVNALEKVQERLLKLISWRTYLNAVDEVRHKRMSLDEKLLKVARPYYEYISMEGFFVEDAEFIEETVDLKYDLDRSRLNYDTKKYWIEDKRPMLNAASRITTHDFECFENRSYTLHNLYMYGKNKHAEEIEREKRYLTEFYRRNVKSKQWLNGLTREKIASKDFLTQILVVYTIKRATNGDRDASRKLFDLYKSTAGAYAKKWAFNGGLPVDEVKQETLAELYRWLSGLSPKKILEAIFKGKELHSLPKWVKKLFLYHLTEHIPALLKIAIATGSHSLFIYCLDPSSIVTPGTKWRGIYNKAHTRIVSLRKQPIRLCNKTFIPQKQNNLTVWLFGTKKNRFQGKFFQLLSDISKRYEREKQKKLMPFDEPVDKKLGRQDGFGNPALMEMPLQLSIKHERGQIIKILKNKFGVSDRDAKIFVDCLQKKKRKELAQKYALSVKRIYTIFTNIKNTVSGPEQ